MLHHSPSRQYCDDKNVPFVVIFIIGYRRRHYHHHRARFALYVLCICHVTYTSCVCVCVCYAVGTGIRVYLVHLFGANLTHIFVTPPSSNGLCVHNIYSSSLCSSSDYVCMCALCTNTNENVNTAIRTHACIVANRLMYRRTMYNSNRYT